MSPINSQDSQTRSPRKSSLPRYVSSMDGDVGWQAKRLIVQSWRAFWQFDLHRLEQGIAQIRQLERIGVMRQHMLSQHELLLGAALALVRDDIDTAMRLADQVALGAQTEDVATVTSVIAQFGAWRCKDWRHFDLTAGNSPCAIVDKRRLMPAILGLTVEAAAEMKRSRLVVAKRLVSDAMRLASRLRTGKAFALANAATVMGELLYEQGELEEANALLRRHLASIARYGCADALESAFITLSRIAFNRGQWKMAGLLSQELVDIAKARGWPRVVAMGYLHDIDLRYCMRDLDRVRTSMRELQRVLHDGKSDLPRAEVDIINSEATLRLSALTAPRPELLSDLRQCIAELSGRGDDARSLKLGMILVEVLTLLGEDVKAELEMRACLKLGMQLGMFQSFFRGSGILREKMVAVYSSNLLARGADVELRTCLASLIGRERDSMAAAQSSASVVNKNAITAREREILLRMGQGHSNKKIAKDLGIGPETVKSHAKRIFFKFGVATRIEAVSYANDLSLI